MADKKMTLQLGGQDYVLNFGTPRHYKVFKETTGKDLFVLVKEGIDAVDLFGIAAGLIYAGHVSECKLNKTQPSLTIEQIDDFVWEGETGIGTKVFNGYVEIAQRNGEEGEPVGQTENL